MKLWRILTVHFVNQLLQTGLGFQSGLEHQEQMIESHAVGDRAAIVSGVEGCGGGIPWKGNQVGFVDRTSDENDRFLV
jgi:hypothetical protein